MPFTASTWRPICSSTFCNEEGEGGCRELGLPGALTGVCQPRQREADGSDAKGICRGLRSGETCRLLR